MDFRILGIFISLILLAGLLYFSGFDRIFSTFSRANAFFIILGFVLWLFDTTLRVIRWNLLLKRVNIFIPLAKTLRVYLAGIFLSNLTPAKSGEPIRSIILKKTDGVGIANSLPSVVIERIFDLISMITIFIIGFLLLGSAISGFYIPFFIIIILFLLALGTLLYSISSKPRTTFILQKLFFLLSFIPFLKKYRNRVNRFAINIQNSFLLYKNPKTLFITYILSIIIWISEATFIFIGFKALNLDVPLIQTIVFIPIASLAALLTFLPGSIGSYEIILVLLYSSIFPLTVAEITAAVLLGRIFSIWTFAFIGSISLSTLKYNHKI